MNLPVIDKERTGNKIKMYMQQQHMTISQLQLELGMASATNIYYWCRGKYLPSLDRMVHLARIFQCKVDDLIVIKE